MLSEMNRNPMETGRRLSDSNDDMGLVRQESTTCRECGKGFQSWKALYGHMRCHPKKERVFNSLGDDDDDDSLINGKNLQKLVMNSQSDNVSAALPPRRSKRMRYYKTATTSSSSSSVLGIDQDQIEAAQCLMMLVRDVGHRGGLNSVDPDSSQTSSVVLEAQIRSSVGGKRNPGKGDRGFDFACDRNENLESLKIKKLQSVVSDSGFLRVGLKKVQSKVSVDGFLRDDELIKKRKLDDGAGYVKLGKDFSNNKKGNCKRRNLDYSEAELGKNCIEEAETDPADSEFGKYKYNPSKRSRSRDDSDSEKRSRFECRTCNKTFHSHQALGGHRSSHKKIKACISSRIESSENSTETDASADPNNKYCSNETPMVESQDGDMDGVAETAETSYRSKKIAHLVGDSEIFYQKQLLESHDPLDLNLPPPKEEEINDHMNFDSIHVGLISN
ncbi:uncharacterized protein LOC122069523 [Macadamia integrifolia]|uniref:uncharacterized protein LOC122069523 n=1 Tax=Macadamia integrifolia TaxID=60698 RepID=UPI001C500722|nr:uncharacterized protein LOC122069523 [Macadamia integrifolia]